MSDTVIEKLGAVNLSDDRGCYNRCRRRDGVASVGIEGFT